MLSISKIPELFAAKFWFLDKHTSQLKHPLKQSVIKLILISDYACRHIEELLTLLKQDACTALLPREDYFVAIEYLNTTIPQASYLEQLRQFRHTHFLRLMLLELSGIASTEEVMRSWSDASDAMILNALAYCQHVVSLTYGMPKDEAGGDVELYTLAMGKLGGRELNYSSDIDLIFAYSHSGSTVGKQQITNQFYFTKVIQLFIQVMQNTSSQGFVFRVDLRLRPNGESGPLVSSLTALETYYQEQGRDWERYAMVKARLITAALTQPPAWFKSLITAFTYRRYVDFSVIESLRSMKAMIEREVQLNPRLDDIKRGQGGIREVEFIIQNIQLIRGGRLPQLQVQNTLLALAVLKQEQLILRSEALKHAYLFLRALENVLQALNDQQTHSLPKDELKQAQVLLAMNLNDWQELLAKLHQYQRIISYSFHSALASKDSHSTREVLEDKKRILAHQLLSIWQGHVESNMAVNSLLSLGFENAEQCYQMLHTFRHGSRCRRLPQSARMRLDLFIPMLLSELPQYPCTDQVLLQVIRLLENIVNRSAYLALLIENPRALRELLYWFSSSPFITTLLVQHPFLLEVLLDQEMDWHPNSRVQLHKLLKDKLDHVDEFELKEDVLRQFKLTYWLMAARAELYKTTTVIQIGKFLADLAQVIVEQVVDLATMQLRFRYPELEEIKSLFAIIAYGKLGSREMGYLSDLDLVFLHRLPASKEALVTRLTQKIVHMLTTRTQSGLLYSVDTRLRPSGAAGLLVSSMDAFSAYQREQAWIWEHQALIKARVLVGGRKTQQQFVELKRSVFTMPRNEVDLLQEVKGMRAKMNSYQQRDPVKNEPGGLLDLEFLIQYLVLKQANSDFALYSHTLSLLKQLFLVQAITGEQFTVLKKAAQKYHSLLHLKTIQNVEGECGDMQKRVLEICESLYVI